jgi:NodT family efflux transporter outer membrane factor (OMF) lipoprotein
MNARAAPLLGSVLLVGCALIRTHYATPPLVIPAQWQQATVIPAKAGIQPNELATNTIPSHSPWWHAFQDPELDALIDRALQRNADLAAAAIRVRRAQLEAQLASNQLFPTVSADVSARETRTLYAPRYTAKSAGGSLAASYEIDLWGRLSSVSESARWEAKASEQDRESTVLSLVGTIMRLYWQSAYLSQLVDSSEQSIAYAEQTLRLIQTQYRAGEVTELEVVEAHRSLEAQLAGHSELLQQQSETANALALLFNTAPEQRQLVGLRDLNHVSLPDVAAGLPANLLSHRPDVRAAELRLRETLAGVDATRASFYPTFSLTGGLGTGGTSLADVLRNPIGSLGASVILPLLQWRDLKYTVGISKIQFEEATIEFRKTLYQALCDVENALTAREQLAVQNDALTNTLEDAQRAEHLTEVRYRAGAVALTAWLDAQEVRRNAQNALARNRLNQLANQVTLYQVLGGDAREP